jgi:hypothetical protein
MHSVGQIDPPYQLQGKDLKRWQAVVRRAYPHLRALRGPWRGTINDEYCAAWRSAMLAAGATEPR